MQGSGERSEGQLPMRLTHMKTCCAGCEQRGRNMTKEHVFPEWLIRRTSTAGTDIPWWSGNSVKAKSATLPLCEACNTEFGRNLEDPVAKIFVDLEAGAGISDNEAELLVRWLWKIEGLSWIATHPMGDYSPSFTLKQRVLQPLGRIRKDLLLALSLIQEIDPVHGDKPMGLDSPLTKTNAIFVSGVFSDVAIMVLLAEAAELVPVQFTQHRLSETPDIASDSKLIFPKTGFRDDNEAVMVTANCSFPLVEVHEKFARRVRGRA
jgi:hypothetical protein